MSPTRPCSLCARAASTCTATARTARPHGWLRPTGGMVTPSWTPSGRSGQPHAWSRVGRVWGQPSLSPQVPRPGGRRGPPGGGGCMRVCGASPSGGTRGQLRGCGGWAVAGCPAPWACSASIRCGHRSCLLHRPCVQHLAWTWPSLGHWPLFQDEAADETSVFLSVICFLNK